MEVQRGERGAHREEWSERKWVEEVPRGKGARKGRTGAEQVGTSCAGGTWGNARQQEGVRRSGEVSRCVVEDGAGACSHSQGTRNHQRFWAGSKASGALCFRKGSWRGWIEAGWSLGEAPAVGHWINDRAWPRAVEMKWRLRRNDLYSKANLWIYNGHEPTQPLEWLGQLARTQLFKLKYINNQRIIWWKWS